MKVGDAVLLKGDVLNDNYLTVVGVTPTWIEVGWFKPDGEYRCYLLPAEALIHVATETEQTK